MDDFERLKEIKKQLFKITGLDEPSGVETNLVLNGQDDRKVSISDKGFDAMGEYDSVKKSIHAVRKKHFQMRQDLKRNRANLRLIVMIHEAAHFVTHTGLGELNGVKLKWEKFEYPDTETAAHIEGSAQSATRLLLKEAAIFTDFKRSQLLKIFDDLTPRQPPQYSVWKNNGEHVKKKSFKRNYMRSAIDAQ